ncbi:MAG: hypothetical protein K2P58_05555 [Hyphomonadaceae bacterium]|nr:hypothetical protein [Hyphomonadaceae bacterium]
MRRVGVVLLLIAAGCGPAPAQVGARGEAAAASAFASAPSGQWRMPARLRELSGFAVTVDGRLFGHDDERAVLYEIDTATGALVKAFALGDPPEAGDFEGLAIGADGVFWLTTSQGVIHRFREGGDGEHVVFERFETGLAGVCDVEGLALLASEQSLILACKELYDRDMRGDVALYRWPLAGTAEPWRRWPNQSFAEAAGVRRFRPSSLDYDAVRGRLVMLSAFDAALAELGDDGSVLSVRALGSAHIQPEAVAVLPDGSLVVGDEGRRAGATLTRYPPRR